MKLLITGGSGFLGKSLIDLLVKAGHEVVVIGRSEPNWINSSKVEFVKADITDQQSLESCKQVHNDIDTIVHMAALVPRTTKEDKAQDMLNVNVTGTLSLLEIFGETVGNFVYASTAEVYGLLQSTGLISESLAPVPASYYGASKLAGELLCQVYASKHNLNISILRFSVLYGPGDTITRAIPNFINKALAGETLEVYGGEELRDYLHVSDAAQALCLAATKSPKGIFNIGTGKGISIKDTAEAIVKAIGSSHGLQILPRQKKASDIVLDVHRAEQAFGFTAKHTFPDLIEEQIEWHRQNQN